MLQASAEKETPGKLKIIAVSPLNSTGNTSNPGNPRRIRYVHNVRGFAVPPFIMWTASIQKLSCRQTSMLRMTEVSSISDGFASQSAICVFDCSMAYGHIKPVNKAQAAETPPTTQRLQ